MAARWIAGAMLLGTLVVIGIFLWAVINPPPPPAEGASGTPVTAEKRISGAAGSWTLAAQAVPRSDRTVALTVRTTDGEGRPYAPAGAPTAILQMLDMAMPGEPVPLAPDGTGSWRGTARVSMAGRWGVQVELGGERLSLSFQAVAL